MPFRIASEITLQAIDVIISKAFNSFVEPEVTTSFEEDYINLKKNSDFI